MCTLASSQVWHYYFFNTNDFPIKPTGIIIIGIWYRYHLMKIFYLPLDRLLDFPDPVHRKNDQRNTHCSPAQILRLKDFCRNQLGMDVKTCNQFPLDNSIQEGIYQPKRKKKHRIRVSSRRDSFSVFNSSIPVKITVKLSRFLTSDWYNHVAIERSKVL